jgi:glycosyltransferase involved in cell wall biosynthesis
MHNQHLHIVTGGTPGLIQDARVVSDALSSSFVTSIHVSRQRNLHLLHQQGLILADKIFGSGVNLGIFLENIPSGWHSVMSNSVLIPNQEWLRPHTLLKMKKCRQIWCKTRYAERLFQQRGFDARFIGFSAQDCLDPKVLKDFGQFLHIQGRSQLKGTDAVLDAWTSHPEWPQLTVISRDTTINGRACANIKVINRYVSEIELTTLMNCAGVHLCTSETEGFGHYISEALSAGAIVVTTDAPPMNELVRPGNGVLVDYERVTMQGWTERFHISPADLAAKIEQIISMPLVQKMALSNLARESFVQNAAEFEARIARVASEL